MAVGSELIRDKPSNRPLIDSLGNFCSERRHDSTTRSRSCSINVEGGENGEGPDDVCGGGRSTFRPPCEADGAEPVAKLEVSEKGLEQVQASWPSLKAEVAAPIDAADDERRRGDEAPCDGDARVPSAGVELMAEGSQLLDSRPPETGAEMTKLVAEASGLLAGTLGAELEAKPAAPAAEIPAADAPSAEPAAAEEKPAEEAAAAEEKPAEDAAAAAQDALLQACGHAAEGKEDDFELKRRGGCDVDAETRAEGGGGAGVSGSHTLGNAEGGGAGGTGVAGAARGSEVEEEGECAEEGRVFEARWQEEVSRLRRCLYEIGNAMMDRHKR